MRSNTRNLGVTLYFLSQGGGGTIPTRGTERGHGGTIDTDFTHIFLDFKGAE